MTQLRVFTYQVVYKDKADLERNLPLVREMLDAIQQVITEGYELEYSHAVGNSIHAVYVARPSER